MNEKDFKNRENFKILKNGKITGYIKVTTRIWTRYRYIIDAVKWTGSDSDGEPIKAITVSIYLNDDSYESCSMSETSYWTMPR